jgi:hypothetical protein
MFVAHGVGTRSDLPLPVSLAAIGAGLVLMISFAVLAVLWRGPRLSRNAGIPLPPVLIRMADGSGTRTLLQSVTLTVGLLVCMIGFVGPADLMRNLAPWALFVTFWVGLVPASLLFGPVWRVLNPLRLVHAALAEMLRVDPEQGVYRLPEAVGYWPAAASLAGYGWFELVYPRHAQPIPTAVFLTLYAVVHAGAAVIFGRRWFERGDGFEVYSTLLGTLARWRAGTATALWCCAIPCTAWTPSPAVPVWSAWWWRWSVPRLMTACRERAGGGAPCPRAAW